MWEIKATQSKSSEQTTVIDSIHIRIVRTCQFLELHVATNLLEKVNRSYVWAEVLVEDSRDCERCI